MQATEIIGRKEARLLGKNVYFTGKACKHGHVALRQVSGGNCKECLAVFERENRERVNTKSREWVARNHDKRLSVQRAHRETHPGYQREWRCSNPDMARVHGSNLKARKWGIVCELSANDWTEIKAKYDGVCVCCGVREPDISLTIDHVQPLSLGGRHHRSNIQPLCMKCNRAKGVKSDDYRPAD